MSTPRTLTLPGGVRHDVRDVLGTPIASLRADAVVRRGTVVLVPGWTGSKEDFAPVLPLLADAGFDAVAYDQPGQLDSGWFADGDYSLRHLAEVAAEVGHTEAGLPNRLSAHVPVHLLGHSFGGLVAQQAVVSSPGTFASLSLLCTGPGALGDSPARPLNTLIEAIDAYPLAAVHAELQRHRPAGGPPEIAAWVAHKFVSNDPRSLRAMTQHLIDAPDVVDDVVASGTPVWVGRGARDDAWPHDVQDQMARRLGTTVHVVPRSAHSPAIENPRGLMDVWLPFLREF